ncbi:hypothetical protein ACLB2K_002241 [Fragaria x ananassa]
MGHCKKNMLSLSDLLQERNFGGDGSPLVAAVQLRLKGGSLPSFSRQIGGDDGGFARRHSMNKTQSKFDPILDLDGLGLMKGIGVLGGIMSSGSGDWELFLVGEFQSLPCGCAPVLPSLCLVGESDGDVEGVGDGLRWWPRVMMTAAKGWRMIGFLSWLLQVLGSNGFGLVLLGFPFAGPWWMQLGLGP